MIARWLRLLTGNTPVVSEASLRDVPGIAAMHAQSFRRGWSEDEVERLLLDGHVLAHRVTCRRSLAGFIISRFISDEAEILSVAIAAQWRGRGFSQPLLDVHLRRLAGLGVRTLFLEVDSDNAPALKLYARAGFREVGRREGYYPHPRAAASPALVLRRELA
jgi:ribosomal-protein-alanine N-acetyltransferase